MTARHAGESRIADQALIDQVRACAADLRAQTNPITLDIEDWHGWLAHWAGRALYLLEQIGELGQ